MPVSPADRLHPTARSFVMMFAITAGLAACAGDVTAPEPAGLRDVTSGGMASVVSRDRFIIPVDETFVASSACAGEDIRFHYIQEIRVHQVITSQGEHLNAVIVDKGSVGLGLTSGARYILNGGGVEHRNGRMGELRTAGFMILDRYIGQGSAPNVVVQERFWLTIRPDGSIVFDRADLKIQQCL